MNMLHVIVQSSNIASVAYDGATQTLEVIFQGGRTWRYADVPPEEHAALMAAESVGKHFHAHIRNKFAATPAVSVVEEIPFDAFEAAQDAFNHNPGNVTAAALLTAAMECEAAGELSDDGFRDTLVAIRDMLAAGQ